MEDIKWKLKVENQVEVESSFWDFEGEKLVMVLKQDLRQEAARLGCTRKSLRWHDFQIWLVWTLMSM